MMIDYIKVMTKTLQEFEVKTHSDQCTANQ